MMMKWILLRMSKRLVTFGTVGCYRTAVSVPENFTSDAHARMKRVI